MTEVLTLEDTDDDAKNVIPLSQFIADFGEGLLEAVQRENPPVYQACNPDWDAILDGLKRDPYDAQRDRIHAALTLLQIAGERAAVINGEMGTGKTLMAIAAATVLHHEGCRRALCIVPPHLVYKWRREILETVPDAKVWVLNGPDSLAKLLMIREMIGAKPEAPEFFVLGRVRMRMGFHWKPAFAVRSRHARRELLRGSVENGTVVETETLAACPSCGAYARREDERVVMSSCWPKISRAKSDSPAKSAEAPFGP